METDPMNSLINVMSKLDEDEGLAIQYIVRSAKPGWHAGAGRVVAKIHQGKTMSEALNLNKTSKALSFFGDVASSAKPPTPTDPNNQYKQPPRLTSMEEEMLKGIEEKNSKAGLDVNLRIIVSTKNKGKTTQDSK